MADIHEQHIADLRTGSRRALARAITLAESTRADHRSRARDLLEALPQRDRPAWRIGLSGTPGVGKSTFIETFGLMLIEQGLKVAVLAVDPSSARSGGSILGDKTRMERLSREANAFIRPSPSRATLGGVSRRTREVIALTEAAGFDVILVETVGVGQSETMVSQMVDAFVLLLAPAGGDELQGVKRGIMEIADILLINKADGALKDTATRTCADYASALHLMRRRPQDPDGFPKALTVSALSSDGIAAAWEEMRILLEWRQSSSHFQTRRAEQAHHWLRQELHDQLIERFQADPAARAALNQIENAVATGQALPEIAAADLLQAYLNKSPLGA